MISVILSAFRQLRLPKGPNHHPVPISTSAICCRQHGAVNSDHLRKPLSSDPLSARIQGQFVRRPVSLAFGTEIRLDTLLLSVAESPYKYFRSVVPETPLYATPIDASVTGNCTDPVLHSVLTPPEVDSLVSARAQPSDLTFRGNQATYVCADRHIGTRTLGPSVDAPDIATGNTSLRGSRPLDYLDGSANDEKDFRITPN